MRKAWRRAVLCCNLQSGWSHIQGRPQTTQKENW